MIPALHLASPGLARSYVTAAVPANGEFIQPTSEANVCMLAHRLQANGVGQALYRSVDGRTWTNPLTFGGSVYITKWDDVGSQFIAFEYRTAANYRVRTSTDGITWTDTATNIPNTAGNTLRYIGYLTTSALHVAAHIGSSTTVWTSPDLATWTQRTPPAAPCGGIVMSHGVLLFADLTAPSAVTVWRSTTALTGSWSLVTTGITADSLSLAYASGRFLAFGNNSQVYRQSPDGLAWSDLPVPAYRSYSVPVFGLPTFSSGAILLLGVTITPTTQHLVLLRPDDTHEVLFSQSGILAADVIKSFRDRAILQISNSADYRVYL